MRDTSKHERSAFNYDDPLSESDAEEMGAFNSENAADSSEAEEAEVMRQDRLEDLFNMNRTQAFQEAVSYEPVMYKLVKEQGKNQKDQSLLEIQEGFLDRTERLLR